MIRMCNVYKQYKDGQVLINTNLHIQEGDFVYLTGPSGSGKSTIIKLLTKQENASNGSILVQGQDIALINKRNDIQSYRRKIGIVFQDYQLIEDITVYENLKFVLEYLGFKSKEIKNRINSLTAELNIAHLLNKKVHSLSGGEQQRIAIVRALINNPVVVFADEPTGNLDAKSKSEVIDLLKAINKKGTTVMVVTHDVDLIENESADKVYKIIDGRVVSNSISVG